MKQIVLIHGGDSFSSHQAYIADLKARQMDYARLLHLVAGGYNFPGHDYGSFQVDSATGLEKSAEQIHLYHSQDDPVVPFEELAKFQKDLPGANVHIFADRGHFIDPDFPELIEILQQK